MHWPTHVNVLPILTYPPVPNWLLDWFIMMELLSKGFCFGFDLTDLFDLHLGYIPLYGFRDCGYVIWY